MASPTQLWLDCLPPLHTVEAGFLQSVEPMLLRAGYSANGRYWILETDRKAIVVTLHCYALIATNWEQGDDLAWRDVDTNVITDIEAEDAAGTVQEWLKQR